MKNFLKIVLTTAILATIGCYKKVEKSEHYEQRPEEKRVIIERPRTIERETTVIER